jgi:hypothetical protein
LRPVEGRRSRVEGVSSALERLKNPGPDILEFSGGQRGEPFAADAKKAPQAALLLNTATLLKLEPWLESMT